MTPDVETEVEATLWRILRPSYLRLLCHGGTRPPEALSIEEQNGILDLHFPRIDADVKAIRVVIEHAVSRAMEHVQGQLHGAPGIDHEMVDQAVHYAVLDEPERSTS